MKSGVFCFRLFCQRKLSNDRPKPNAGRISDPMFVAIALPRPKPSRVATKPFFADLYCPVGSVATRPGISGRSFVFYKHFIAMRWSRLDKPPEPPRKEVIHSSSTALKICRASKGTLNFCRKVVYSSRNVIVR